MTGSADRPMFLCDRLAGFFGSMHKYVHVSVKRGNDYGLQSHFCVDEEPGVLRLVNRQPKAAKTYFLLAL